MRSKKHLKYALVSVLLILSASLVLIGCTAKHVRVSNAISPDSNMVASIQKDIRQREYHASENTKGLQAPNRAHNLRTYFDKDGITIEDRTAEGSPMLVKMTLTEMGREGLIREITKDNSVVTTKDNRIEIAHRGITEWYENTAKGLEQGFTVEEKPEGKGQLIVGINVEGAEGRLKGDRILLQTAMGRELEYGKLKVTDRNGTEVPSEMGVTGKGTIQIAVNDIEAVYPIIIDPLITGEPDTIIEDSVTSVSGAGDINNDGYDDVIAGCATYDNGETSEGAVFIYYGNSSGLGATPDILESNQAYTYLGQSVAGAGDIDNDGYADVIAGAWLYTNGQSQEGAVYVYYGSSSGIGTTPDILESNQANANLGCSVSGAGDIDNDGYADVIAGAPSYTNGQSYEGAALVYYGSSSGIGTTPDILDSNQSDSSFGISVSGAGDIDNNGYDDVIVGAAQYDNGETNEGAAFVYYGSSSGIGTTPVMLDSDQASAYLGQVSGAGDIDNDGYDDVIVGAPYYDNGQTDEGAVFVYYGGSSGIGTTPDMLESDQASARLGESVSGAGDVNGDGYDDAIVGAPYYDNGQTDEGAAFVYYGGSSGIGTTPDILESDQASARLGESVSGAGDVNGDGYADIIIRTTGYSGALYLYLGGIVFDSITHNRTDPLDLSVTGYPYVVTWTASATGGSGDYSYRFWKKGPHDSVYQIVQDYSSNNQYQWTVYNTDAGLTSVIAVVRDEATGKKVDGTYEDFEVIPPDLTFGSITHDSTDPLTISGEETEVVTWTVTATEGSGYYEYRFWKKGPNDSVYQLVQDYSASNQYQWTVDADEEGLTSVIGVVRDQVTEETVNGTYEDFEVIVQ